MRYLIALCGASVLLAQGGSQGGGTDPKPKAEEYDVHAVSKGVSIGAEFMIHSFSGQGQTYITNDFLVVEVALYPPKDMSVDPPKYTNVRVSSGEFALRINGKKQTLAPVAPGMVVSTLQNAEWQSGPHLEGGGGLGNTGVILGRPTPTTVPGGQQPPQRPRVPQAPTDSSGVEREQRVSASDLLMQTALPNGTYRGPVSGYLYFPYRGRGSSVKSLELIYDDAVLKMR